MFRTIQHIYHYQLLIRASPVFISVITVKQAYVLTQQSENVSFPRRNLAKLHAAAYKLVQL